MFAPNVWSFDPPKTQIVHKYSESNEKHEKQICKRIHSHPFNRMVRLHSNFTDFPSKIMNLQGKCCCFAVFNRILVQCIQYFVYIEIASNAYLSVNKLFCKSISRSGTFFFLNLFLLK